MLRGKYRTFNIQLVYKEGPGWDEDVIRSSVYSSPSLSLSLSLTSIPLLVISSEPLLCYHQTSINSKHRALLIMTSLIFVIVTWCDVKIIFIYFTFSTKDVTDGGQVKRMETYVSLKVKIICLENIQLFSRLKMIYFRISYKNWKLWLMI